MWQVGEGDASVRAPAHCLCAKWEEGGVRMHVGRQAGSAGAGGHTRWERGQRVRSDSAGSLQQRHC